MNEIALRNESYKVVETKISTTKEILEKLENFSISDLQYLSDEIKKELIEMYERIRIYKGEYKLEDLFYFDNELCIWNEVEPIKLKDIVDPLKGKIFRPAIPYNKFKTYFEQKVDFYTVIPYIEKDYLKMHDLHKKWRTILTYLSYVRTNLTRPTQKQVEKEEKINAAKRRQYLKSWKRKNSERYEEYKKAGNSPTEIADMIINDFEDTDLGFRRKLIGAIKQDLETNKGKKKSKRKSTKPPKTY